MELKSEQRSSANWTPPPTPTSEPETVDFHPPESQTHLRDYWYIILKRRWVILAVFISVLSYTAVRALMRQPVYSATTVLQIDRGKINLVQDVLVQDYWSGYDEFYPTQQRVLMSRNLSKRVVQQLRLWEQPYFGGDKTRTPDEQSLEGLAARLVGMLQVTQIRNTQLMALKFTSTEPKVAADLANALARQYMTFSMEKETTLARDTASFIREQVEKIQVEIQEREKLLQEYSQRQDLMMVDEKELLVMRQLQDLNSAVAVARTSRAKAEANYRSLQAAQTQMLPAVLANPTVQGLVQQRGVLEGQIAELAAKFKDDWPDLRRAREALTDIKKRIQIERNTLTAEVVATAQVEYRASVERENLLLAEVEAQKREAQALSKLTTDYSQIKAGIDNQRSMLQQLLRRQSETGLSAELGEREPVNVRIVEAALVPRAPTGPSLSRSLFLGSVVGIALALGLALFLDYWETTIYTIEDLRRHVPLPYMGMVPRLDSDALSRWDALGANSIARESDKHGKNISRTRSALALSQSAKSLPVPRKTRR